MRILDLETLHIFRCVVAEGGVVRAAQRLNRVQSNVTTRIRQLEERLGVGLFRREGRGLRLTAEGHKLLAYAEQLLRLAEEATQAMRGGMPLGRFRLGSLESAAGVRLPPVLVAYHERFPQVEVELATGPTAMLIARVQKYELDAAFVSEPFSAPGLECVPVFAEELVLAAPCGMGRAEAINHARRTIIVFAQGCSYRRRLEEWLASEAVRPARVLEYASYQAMVACVAAGAGVAIIPLSVVTGLSAQGQVSLHDLPAPFAANRTHLVWRAPAIPPIEALRAVLADLAPV